MGKGVGAAWMAAALAGVSALTGVAQAQVPGVVPGAAPALPAPPRLNVSRAERAAIAPLAQAVEQSNWTAAAAALPGAQAGGRSADARYAIARYQLVMAVGTGNAQGQQDAIDAIIATGVATPEEQASLLRQQAGAAFLAQNYVRADALLTRQLQARPNDPETLGMLGQVARSRGMYPQSIDYFRRSLAGFEAANVRPPEHRYKVALATAFQERQRPVVADLGRRLVLAYPSAANWRDVLLDYRDIILPPPPPNTPAPTTPPPADVVEVLRLMRATGALAGERDYLSTATAMNRAGFPSEARAILTEGVERGMLSTTEQATSALITQTNTRATAERGRLAQLPAQGSSAATATAALSAGDILYGNGRYTEAADVYRAALTKTGADAAQVNLRLGSALALAGQRAPAEAALRTITGEKAEIAGFWLAWLARRPVAG